MKHFTLIALVFTALVSSVRAREMTPSRQLLDEYEQLRTVVSRLQPDNPNAMDYYLEKDYGDHIIMWKLENGANNSFHEVIRLYIKPLEDVDPFAVTYYKTTTIVPETMILRKFIGPEPLGWRNDTIDYTTEEYLGHQGSSHVPLSKRAKDILTQWNITPFIF